MRVYFSLCAHCSCWVDGPYFSAYYGLVGGALLLANFLCFKSVRWLDHVHLVKGFEK